MKMQFLVHYIHIKHIIFVVRKLDKLAGDVSLLRREVAELRGKSPATSTAFKIETASCKVQI